MKNLKVLGLLVLVFSFNAFSQDWICVGETEKDSSALASLKLKKEVYLKGSEILIVSKEKYCGLMKAAMYRDACAFFGNTMNIDLADRAELRTKKKKTINLNCEESKVVGPIGIIGGTN